MGTVVEGYAVGHLDNLLNLSHAASGSSDK